MNIYEAAYLQATGVEITIGYPLTSQEHLRVLKQNDNIIGAVSCARLAACVTCADLIHALNYPDLVKVPESGTGFFATCRPNTDLATKRPTE